MKHSLIDKDRTGRLLDVGSGPFHKAATFYPQMTVTRLDVDPAAEPDIVHDITQPLPAEWHGQFNGALLGHVLEHFPYRQVVTVLRHLHAALAEGGEILILVPSLEWAAEQIMSGAPSPAIQAHIFGSQSNDWQFHRSGFTLPDLRYVLEAAGFVTVYAAQGGMQIILGDQTYPALQNVALGRKAAA